MQSPRTRLALTTAVRAYASGAVSVPDAEQFLPGGASAGFTATWPDISTGAPTVNVSDLSEVLDLDLDASDPQALLGVVLRVLQQLDTQLAAPGGGGVLGTKIPLVDQSLRDFLGQDQSGGGPAVSYTAGTLDPDGAGPLPAAPTTILTDSSRGLPGREFPVELAGRSVVVGTQVGIVLARTSATQLVLSALESTPAGATPYSFRSELADALSLLTADPPDSVQQLVKALDARLGGSYVKFRYAEVGGAPHLVVALDWKRAYATSTPVRFDVGSQKLAGTSGAGTAT